MVSLKKLAAEYLSERIVKDRYVRAVNRIATSCGRLTVDACNRYLRKRIADGASSVTVHYERGVLVSLWRWAYESGKVDQLPRGMVKVRRVKPPTRAWTVAQCCTAVKGTAAMGATWTRSGANLGRFLRAWLLIGYETGARPGDLWAMRAENFRDNTLYWNQSKTGQPVPKVLSPKCYHAVQEMLASSPDGTLFRWVMPQDSARRVMRRYLRSLGLPGSPKWLRRSSATHVEIEKAGTAKIFLGHKTPGMAENYYIDWTQVHREIPQVPALVE